MKRSERDGKRKNRYSYKKPFKLMSSISNLIYYILLTLLCKILANETRPCQVRAKKAYYILKSQTV